MSVSKADYDRAPVNFHAETAARHVNHGRVGVADGQLSWLTATRAAQAASQRNLQFAGVA
jgi:hypothetical protein